MTDLSDGGSVALGTTAASGQRAMMQLGAMVFVVALGYGVGLPLLQLYLTRYLGSAKPSLIAWHVGMLGGVYTFALFVFAPLWGRLSDRNGRTVVLTVAFGTFLLGTVVAALAPSLSIAYAARFLAGTGASAIVPTAQAYIDDISAPVVRSRRFVLLGSASFVGARASWSSSRRTAGATGRSRQSPPIETDCRASRRPTRSPSLYRRFA